MVIFYSVFSQNQLRSVSPVIQVKAAQLAQAYLEEIGLKRFDELSPVGNGLRCDAPSQTPCSGTLASEGGEDRTTYDDIDDFNGLSESPPRDALNVARSGFNGFSVAVNVTYAGGDLGFPARSLKKVELTVTTSGGDQFVFSQYKGNF